MAKTGTSINRGGWLSNPKKERPGEKIGGGFFVFRRGDSTGRIRPTLYPYEHPDMDSACVEADRLAVAFPGERFEVFSTMGVSYMHAASKAA